ncbi:hypothetical protein KUTeg_022538 [Tegillarca granosa]|uniref:Uncharacterized protein n=1 Tax=Tegillarca granosa TaxID=220873 RepID=A0ABQ9E9B4_TEGGR|nr:hypothetical protein KUTeg_022538 [Tegillarca granosa]
MNSSVSSNLKDIGQVIYQSSEVSHGQVFNGYNMDPLLVNRNTGQTADNVMCYQTNPAVVGHANLNIYKRLEKLTVLDDISNRLSKIETKFVNVEAEINAMRVKANTDNERLTTLENKIVDIGSGVDFIERDRDELYNLTSELREEILDMQTRSIRDNLLFSGINRVFSTNQKGDVYEDAEAVLNKFLKEEMDINEEIAFERVHRIGRAKHGKHPLIIAKFKTFKQREQERRKRLIPNLKEAKRKKYNAKLVADKLYIDGRRYGVEDELPFRYIDSNGRTEDYDARFDR